ncbi:hypothetical protein Ancab_008215, partial [Ancistrocladus abbreviatus]
MLASRVVRCNHSAEKRNVGIGRLRWIRVFGINLHIWNTECFRKLAKRWGVFLGLDDKTRNRDRLEFARLSIFSSVPDAVSDSFKINQTKSSSLVRTVKNNLVSEWERGVNSGDRQNDNEHLEDITRLTGLVADAYKKPKNLHEEPLLKEFFA